MVNAAEVHRAIAFKAVYRGNVPERAVAWQLLARDLARHGGPFAGLPARRFMRYLGDLSMDGRGELILAA